MQEMTGTTRCYLDQQMQQPAAVTLAGGEAAVFSARCPGKETANEDAMAVAALSASSAVLILADGMGGGRAGEAAARAAVEIVAAALGPLRELAAENQMEESTLRAAVLNGIEQANAAVKSQGNGSATTLVVAAIHDGSVRTFHVGDSPAMLIGGRGRVKFATVSHSPVGLAVEAGVLDADDAMHHEDRHLVLNMLGSDAMRIEMGSPTPLAPHDRLLLASDGLTDNLTDAEIVEMARFGSALSAAGHLAEAALQRMSHPQPGQPSKPDELSLILFRPTHSTRLTEAEA
jgi:PPM family protein phosphatase